MGWSFSSNWHSRAEMLEYLRDPARFGEHLEVLHSQAVGNNHWYLAHNLETGMKWIGLDLMQGGGRGEGWGYKSIDESMGPVEVNCPLSYLDQASEPTGYAIEWRRQVRDYHARRAARPALAPGVIAVYGSAEYRLLESLGRKGWSVERLSDGLHFRMSVEQLNQAEIRVNP